MSIFSSRLRSAIPRVLQHGDGGKQFGKRAAEAVETYDGQDVAFARVGQERGQARPVHRAAGADIGEHLDGAGLGQPHGLSGDILIAGGDPCVAQDAAPMPSPNRPFCWTAMPRLWCSHADPSTNYVSQIVSVHNQHWRFLDGGGTMARRQLLTDEERRRCSAFPQIRTLWPAITP